jgi:uncharacterized protein
MIQRPFKISLIWSLFVSCLLVPTLVFAYTSPGNPTGFVNDFAHVLTIEQKNSLENKLHDFNASTTNEIAVVTVKTLGGDYIENYSVKLFKEWQIGKVKQDNGVLLLVAVDDHQIRIEVGYGLEGVLTDALSSQIIRNDLTPAFKQNDFYGGIDAATNHIIQATKGEYTANVVKNDSSHGISAGLLGFFGLLLLQGLIFLASIFARSKSWWAGGVAGGTIGIVMTFLGIFGITLVIGSIITVVLTLLGLLFDYIVSNTFKQSISSGSGIPWWVGGVGRGGGSSGSSFGGFGGGSSGGGGASGSW